MIKNTTRKNKDLALQTKQKMVYTHKKIIDSDGIEYDEVDYDTYLNSVNKHRIVQSLRSRYFVEVDATGEKK